MKFNLRKLILYVALLAVLLTLVSSLVSGYLVDRQTLRDITLETNRIYAQKLADTTDIYISMMMQTLENSAEELTPIIGESNNEPKLFHEANRLLEQTQSFNSTVIASKDGNILASSPESLNIVGETIESKEGKKDLLSEESFISEPFYSSKDKLILLITHPIFDEEQNYLGIVGGTIYLLEDNILNDLLDEHFYEDSSYVFVVDGLGNIIYHQTRDRIKDLVNKNAAVEQLMLEKSGKMQLINTKGIDMLAGYAYIPTLDWGIVSQRPTEDALAPSKTMIYRMILNSIPLLIVSIVIIVFISRLIAKPLNKLAYYAESSIAGNNEDEIDKVRTWYYEATQLKEALAHSLSTLHERVNYYIHQSTTDPLTRLLNRRGLTLKMNELVADGTSFSVILIDIDRFKRINDTYGHAVGDEVLQFLANEMKKHARKQDTCCRFGGEEFILLLPDTDIDEAFRIAESFRIKIANTMTPANEIITISSGLATYPIHGDTPDDVIEKADVCLYEAKNSGRNKNIAYSGS